MEEIDVSTFVYPPDQALSNAIDDLEYTHNQSLYFSPVVSILIKQALDAAKLEWRSTVTEKTNILACIQAAIHAPKGQRNEFGGFNYRSAEDILAHAKPILAEFDQSLVLDDEIVMIGDRYYVKATATIHPLGAHAVAYAREQQDKKGMDHAQITGATSSYARKYALAGVLALDNEKDADTMDNAAVKAAPRINRARAQEYNKLIEDALSNEDGVGLRQINEELQLDEAMHRHVWNFFTTKQKTEAKALLSTARDK